MSLLQQQAAAGGGKLLAGHCLVLIFNCLEKLFQCEELFELPENASLLSVSITLYAYVHVCIFVYLLLQINFYLLFFVLAFTIKLICLMDTGTSLDHFTSRRCRQETSTKD